jgi:hypothetical protein
VTDDLRRVHTAWRYRGERATSRRPKDVDLYTDDLAAVEDLRRRLRAHVTALRQRFEDAMLTGRTWTTDEWAAKMFRDPLRAAMARRLIWRIESEHEVLVLPGERGLRDIERRPVHAGIEHTIVLWHPADDPDAQQRWRERLREAGISQPIAQAFRDILLGRPRQP